MQGNGLLDKIGKGWGIQGIAVVEIGQPYSVIDYIGAAGGIFYGTTDGITNPVVPHSKLVASGFTVLDLPLRI